MPAGQKRLYLTFDDGPNPGITEEVLEVLDSFRVKATFFVLGEKAEQYPELVGDILNRGHGLGSHGWLHLDGWKTSLAAYTENAGKHNQTMPLSLFRPPFGRITPNQTAALRKMGFQIVMWSASAEDYNWKDHNDHSLRKLFSKTHDGSIVLFHDSPQAIINCRIMLPKFLDHFLSKNYRFEILPRAYLQQDRSVAL
jgi:peptidoglycan/xylan/chitin deacetylase (PgdA/CDA1 family)